MSPSLTRYSTVAVILHWLMAFLLVGLVVVGLYMTSLPFSPLRIKLFNWHKWVGILALLLACIRLAWRWTHAAPTQLSSIRSAMYGWQRWAYRFVHLLLYVSFFAVPMLGWAYSSATGFTVKLFGIVPLPDWVSVDKSLAETLKQAHHYAAYSMTALVLLHVGAAMKHHFIDRDPLLRLMWFRSQLEHKKEK